MGISESKITRNKKKYIQSLAIENFFFFYQSSTFFNYIRKCVNLRKYPQFSNNITSIKISL